MVYKNWLWDIKGKYESGMASHKMEIARVMVWQNCIMGNAIDNGIAEMISKDGITVHEITQ